VSPLTFDEASHTYTLDGKPVPAVSRVLQALGDEYAMVDPDVLERAAEIGRAVHWIIEHEIRGDLDEEMVDFHLLPYLDQWREFRRTSGFEPLLTETQVYSRRYRYAGTLDLFGILNGKLALPDAKRTAAVPRKAGPQTAAYEMALRESMPELVARAAARIGWKQTLTDQVPIFRYALHLTPTRWQLVPFKDPADQRVFLSALNIHQWSNA
jgi:hypothetical protein